MLEGIDIRKTLPFTSVEDKSEPKTIFHFRLLKSSEIMDFAGLKRGNEIVFTGQDIINVLDKSIVRIDNKPDSVNKIDFIDSLSSNVLTELFNFMGEINNIGETERKNS